MFSPLFPRVPYLSVLILFLASTSVAAAAGVSCDLASPITTAVLQQAINRCSASGGGLVSVPPGAHIITAIELKSDVELHLQAGAALRLDQEASHWPPRSPFRSGFIFARNARNIAITGRGDIDGQAQHSWGPARRVDEEIVVEIEIARKAGVEMSRWRREGVQMDLLYFENVEDLRLEGIRMQAAPIWTVRLQECNRVWIRAISLFTSLEKGVNGDGIDIVSSSNVFISDSLIETGDDAICLKTMRSDNRGTYPVRPVENVVVTNSVLSSSSTPLMIGTETHADIRHVLFSNIVIRNSNKAFGINVQDGAIVSDVRFTNITFALERRHWNWWGSAEMVKFILKKRTPESRLGRIENVTIDGVQGTARGTSLIAGHPERPLRNISLSNVRLRMEPENRPDRRMNHGIALRRIENLELRNVDVEWLPDARPTGAESIHIGSGVTLRNAPSSAPQP